ncbi:response regulator transcription factor [Sedimenticola selenatireducens]|uniref:response regulator transcription factor n=1 Tax=Sedimenticola selenatireducens TaxID=191960 RepID=UPI00048E5691|nr:response regulator transcription factor [Sedimenticola selenatireducens]
MYLLLIEDNPDLIENLCEFFESMGHAVDIAYNGLTGLGFALENSYDVIVLDLMLPGMDGLEVCSRLRREGHGTPVLMLTARDTLNNKLEGFASGADDYLVKPFALPELEARLNALSRRGRSEITRRRLIVGDLQFDPDTLRVERDGRRIELAPIPLKILALLMRRSPGVVRRVEIEREIWGDDPPDSDTLRAHLHALRTAIDRNFKPALLHTIRGMGYQLTGPDGR